MITMTKMNGNGNNFLILNNIAGGFQKDSYSDLALRACDTKRSVGADGLLVLENSELHDFRMRLFNRNGAEGEMCGNGARCAVRYAYDKGISGTHTVFDTMAGIIKGYVEGDYVGIVIEGINQNEIQREGKITYGSKVLKYSEVRVGVPHCVVFCEENQIRDLEEMESIGRYFDTCRTVFDEGTNVNFVLALGERTIDVITYERGVEGITDSCGTGACASALIAGDRFGIEFPITVKNAGGENRVIKNFKETEEGISLLLEGNVGYNAEITLL